MLEMNFIVFSTWKLAQLSFLYCVRSFYFSAHSAQQKEYSFEVANTVLQGLK